MAWTQSEDKHSKVTVKTKYETKTGEPVTDILIIDKQNGDHVHKGYSLNTGNEVYSSSKPAASPPKK